MNRSYKGSLCLVQDSNIIKNTNKLTITFKLLVCTCIIVAKKSKKSMTKKKQQKEFDPDRLVLTKQEILEFCDDVLEKWEK